MKKLAAILLTLFCLQAQAQYLLNGSFENNTYEEEGFCKFNQSNVYYNMYMHSSSSFGTPMGEIDVIHNECTLPIAELGYPIYGGGCKKVNGTLC